MNRIALVTGATSGIGRATSIILSENNFDVIITGRRKELLEDLEKEIKTKSSNKIFILNFDVRNKEEVDAAIDSWKIAEILLCAEPDGFCFWNRSFSLIKKLSEN